jgi:hypothetical protein
MRTLRPVKQDGSVCHESAELMVELVPRAETR